MNHYIGTEGMVELFELDKPKIAGADTETNGLNIKFSTAFLIIFGWGDRVFTFYPTKVDMERLYHCCKQLDKLYFWNTKYDMHMLTNTGYPYPYNNLSDGMFLARLSLNADDDQSLALKAIAKRFVDGGAALMQDSVKAELTALRKQRNKVLTGMLKGIKVTRKVFDEMEKDLTADFPPEIQEIYDNWNEAFPEPNYADVNRDLMIQYAANDVIIMMKFIEKALPIIQARQQESVLDREDRLIRPLYEMERVGFKMDRKYLEDSKSRLRAYIKTRREELCKEAEQPLKIGQSAEIMKILNERYNVRALSSDRAALQFISRTEPQAKLFCDLIIELRTLEKWYSTYVIGLLENSKFDGRAYTTIFQAGTVSGRVSCNFQQFPKANLYDNEGNTLFEPRRAFKVTGNGHDEIYYLD